MGTLRDLQNNPYAAENRQRREFAFSGQAGVQDIPYLYELQAGRRSRTPAGIGGQDGGLGSEATGAPNPQSLAAVGGSGGGGATGAADVGLPGPGLAGEEEEGFNSLAFFRDQGADAGFGGLDRFDRDFNPAPTEFTNLDSPFGWGLDIVDHSNTPLSLIAKAMKAGIRGSNLSVLNQMLERYGLETLGPLDIAVGVGGFNSYGRGSPQSVIDVIDGRLGDNDPFSRAKGAGLGDPDLSFFGGPSYDTGMGSPSYGGSSGKGSTQSSYSGGGGQSGERSRNDRNDPQAGSKDIRDSGSF